VDPHRPQDSRSDPRKAERKSILYRLEKNEKNSISGFPWNCRPDFLTKFFDPKWGRRLTTGEPEFYRVYLALGDLSRAEEIRPRPLPVWPENCVNFQILTPHNSAPFDPGESNFGEVVGTDEGYALTKFEPN
jgi:hypothetical protein